MTDELIEIAARALVPVTSGGQETWGGKPLPDRQFDDLTPEWQRAYMNYARSALQAIQSSGYVVAPRVPTEGMWKAGMDSDPWGGVPVIRRVCDEVYTAMIEAHES